MKHVPFIVMAAFALIFYSCKKDSFITSPDAEVTITADTLHFDTLFTSTGSATQVFKIKNENDQKLRVDNISLGGGSNSFFKINADGFKGPQISNIEIEANDSIYVFSSVTIDPNSGNLPFIVRDSIQITYNGNKRFVQLEAYGQNAHFLRSLQITGNVSWENDLPYVILGGLLVAENATLTIEKGCRVHFHANAPLIVDGTLKVEGEKYDSTRVYFRGDRLDEPYRHYPGSWPGIYFRESSRDNVMNFAVIQHAYQGVAAEEPSLNANPKLTLNECIIDNIYDAGIFGIRTSIKATNCLISNAGGEQSTNINLIYGGNYDFTHCTVVSYGNSFISHKNPVLYLSNYVLDNNVKYPYNLTARFRNCIFWGENGMAEDEVVVTRDGATIFNVDFSNCLWKAKNDPAHVTMNNIIKNQPPVFDSIDNGKRYYNFRLKDGSPAINEGMQTGTQVDLDGNPRTAGALPDIGAYEKQ